MGIRLDADGEGGKSLPMPGPFAMTVHRWAWLVVAGVLGMMATAESRGETSGSTSNWWAIQPLVKPAVPQGFYGHPIDAFVAEARAERAGPDGGRHGRSSVAIPQADARTLLRRLMVDLHGLVPVPAEVQELGSSPNEEAWRRTVERQLASPRYGERWARHWLDVVHFAETHGHDQDRPRESAWPYRDYVIEAFNADKPYARFVAEQIAADALYPENPRLIPALGFLAAGPWDESSLRDIREDTLDREIGRYLDRDDIVANVMATFTSVTAHCARCHDHKFDPITQRDYYALQAVFAGTEKAERLYDPDPALHARREQWMRLQVALERRDRERVEALLTPEVRVEMADWANSAASRAVAWEVLRPTVFDSRSGADLKRLDDDSLLASGASPAEAIYEVTAPLDRPGVSAIRLEVLRDDSLPQHGPGRAENGNFHLTDFTVSVSSHRESQTFDPVRLLNPTADVNQEGWEIAKAIDTEAKSGWGIHPAEGRSHVAVFEVAPIPVGGNVPGSWWRFVLRQEHGRQHAIGRFRLSVTRDALPIRATTLPESVVLALAKPAAERTTEEQFEITAHYLGARAARELAALPPASRVYAGASVFPANGGQKPVARPRSVRVLRRGEITQPRDEAAPGGLSCIVGLPSDFGASPEEGARRAALARWLTARDNPLVWRSIVNRVWHYHFGRGIVETPNDFGRMGSAPASVALLDWLAVTFRDDLGGSLKGLHALILGSHTWRERAADPQSAALFQPLSRRLDAETFRDSLLRLNGRLDLTMGGPSVKQFAMSEGIHVTPNVDYSAFDTDGAGSCRRSIYRFLFRTLPDPMMDALDCPAGDQSAPVRSESFTALQAFALLNHPFVVRQSEHLAERLAREGGELSAQVDLAGQLVFLRHPTAEEHQEWTRYAAKNGLGNLCRLFLNSNEFHFVD